MLRMMTASQYSEILAFFRVENEEREEREAIAREANLRQWFDRKIAQQERRRAEEAKECQTNTKPSRSA